jgi:sulfide:quinone oxidoreductase
MSKIVIVGSGFAGCTAIRTLRQEGYRDAITLISPKAELFYYPSLIWVPSGRRRREDLEVDLQGFLRRNDVVHKQASMTGLDAATRTVHTDDGDVVYDYLIIASGGRYLRKLPGIEQAHIACAGWDDTHGFAEGLRALEGGRIAFGFAGNPKEPSAMRGGPVFEFLFGTDRQLRQEGRRERFQLTFFSPAPKPGARMGEKAVDRILGEMARRDIATHLGHKLKAMEPGRVVTEGGEVEADLVLFIPGMTGPAWAADSGLPLSDGGFIRGDEFCRVAGDQGPVDRVYVAGDAGSFPGPDWKPKQAHMADLQAEAAARNILAHQAGREASHRFKTELICIVDELTTGTMVYRTPSRSLQLKGAPMHWAKRLFEWHYLRGYRNAA